MIHCLVRINLLPVTAVPGRTKREVNPVAKSQKPKVQENYKTPNEKYNAEFAVENDGTTKQSGSTSKPVQKPQQ